MNYCKDLFDDLCIIKKFYEPRYNQNSNITIDQYIKMFNQFYKDFVCEIFSENTYDKLSEMGTDYAKNCARFCINKIILADNQLDGLFKSKIYLKTDFFKMKEMANKIFMLEKCCSQITKKFWNVDIKKIDKNTIANGIFVKVCTEENWRADKTTIALKKYYGSRLGLSVSYINGYKSKFFRGDKLDVIAGLVYSGNDIISASHFDAFTEEHISGNNPLQNSVAHSKVTRVYAKNEGGKFHEIYAYGTLTATPMSVLSCDNYHNEVILSKKSAKPVAVFYANENSLEYAKKLSKKHKLPIVKLESYNNIDKFGVKMKQDIVL
jgi:hypothetical protein